jgi:hypothetical protein
MSTRSCAASLALMLMATSLPLQAAAQHSSPDLPALSEVEGKAGTYGGAQTQDGQSPDAAARALSPDSHVRTLDREARRLLEVAIASSPTVARMVADLEATDLIVWVEANPFLTKTRGEMLVAAATTEVRHVSIKVKTPGWLPDVVSVLGHELQHALEVAAAHEVRDAAGQRQFYRRIGYQAMDGECFETEAAVEVGRRVAREMAASWSRR